jgi:hypothetical protein
MIIIGRMRAQGFGPEAIQQVYNFIGQQYASAPAGQALIQGAPLSQ